jgi:hypothetical protein
MGNFLPYIKDKAHYILLSVSILMMLYISPLSAQHGINISGENNASYIYRTAKDSLSHYFENELTFRVDHKNITFGMTFLAELPRYDRFDATHELNPSQINTQWTDRYIQINYDDLRVKAGTIEEVYGAGLTLRSWNDLDLQRDKRMEGATVHYYIDRLKLSGVYGALKTDIHEQSIYENDLVIGADLNYRLFDFMTVGTSAVQYKNRHFSGRQYIHNDVFGGRISMMFDTFDIRSEYAEMVRYHNVREITNGNAFFTTANVYFRMFTFSAGYKRYHRFTYPLADLPTLNHYDELLSTYVFVELEEGLQGEVRFIPNFENEFLINYAEAWDRTFNARHYNLFSEYKRDFGSFSASAEYQHLEKLSKANAIWEKEIMPAISFDFYDLQMPMEFKFRWCYAQEEHFDDKLSHHAPYLQVDTQITDNLALSVSAEYKFADWDEFGKNSVFIGGEIVTHLNHHTAIKLFVGKEKGGKVCRNGVCQMQAPFEGVRLSLNTRF